MTKGRFPVESYKLKALPQAVPSGRHRGLVPWQSLEGLLLKAKPAQPRNWQHAQKIPALCTHPGKSKGLDSASNPFTLGLGRRIESKGIEGGKQMKNLREGKWI